MVGGTLSVAENADLNKVKPFGIFLMMAVPVLTSGVACDSAAALARAIKARSIPDSSNSRDSNNSLKLPVVSISPQAYRRAPSEPFALSFLNLENRGYGAMGISSVVMPWSKQATRLRFPIAVRLSMLSDQYIP